MRNLLPALCVLVLLAGSLGAEQAQIRVPVWVERDEGGPEAALAAGNLNVTVGGVAARPAGLLGPADDLIVLVVADLTGDLTLADLAKRALNERIGKLPPNALVGILRAQDGLRVLVDPTADRSAVKTAIDALPVSGRAGLLETVATTTVLGDSILAKANVRVAVLFVTDSVVGNYREDFTNPTINSSDRGDLSRQFRDNLVRERIAKLDASLAAAETPVFVVHLEYRSDTLDQAYQTGLMSLAATTGGAAYFCRSQGEVADAVRDAVDRIASHYSLRVPVPPEAPRRVDVTVDSPGLSLSWRNRFVLDED
jgi:hypothetical protein